MNISVFGLGYVGCVGAACLARFGNKVTGVDVNPDKVALINKGQPTINETGLSNLCFEAHSAGLLSATTVAEEAVLCTDISFISVGTPPSEQGHLNLTYVFDVAKQIGNALRKKKRDTMHIIAIRSTVPPGTNRKVSEIIEKESGLVRNTRFTVVSNPEFLREGSAIKDFLNPPLTLVGTDSPYAADVMRRLYSDIHAEFICTDIEVAEMSKYVNNAYHALKIVFSNEVGNICKSLGIDSHKVMKIFCKDRRLNISPCYFKPGFAYGGSCLPKDTNALRALARDNNVEVPVIENIFLSNEAQKERTVRLIMEQGKRKIGFLGLSFKSGTDDLRDSPIVDVIEALIEKDFNVLIYDCNINLSELNGANRQFILSRIPNLQDLVADKFEYICRNSDVLVVAKKEKEFQNLLLSYPGKTVIDLVRLWDNVSYNGKYEGVSWSVGGGYFLS